MFKGLRIMGHMSEFGLHIFFAVEFFTIKWNFGIVKAIENIYPPYARV
jgi:hypothetical protein